MKETEDKKGTVAGRGVGGMMKKRALRKDFYMEIRKNAGRFISIFLIVALGVAFYAGIQSSAPDMRYTGDVYFDENHLMDLQVMGTLGITEEDVKALESLEEIQKAEPGYGTDVFLMGNGENDVLHIESLPVSLNRVQLVEGEMPKKPGECLLDAHYAKNKGYRPGDVLEVEEDVDEEEDGILTAHRLTVTGIASSPLYISFERGSTQLGSGEIGAFAFVTEEAFDLDVYTKVYLLAEGTKEAVSYTEEYASAADRALEAVKGIKEERCSVRYEEVRSEADEKLADARRELSEKKEEAQEKLADAKEEIEDAKRQLADGKQELADARKELEDGKKELASRTAELEQGKRELSEKRGELSRAKEELAAKEREFQEEKASAEEQIADGEKQIRQAKKTIKANEKTLEQKKKELDAGKKQYEEGKTALEQAVKEIEAAAAAGWMTPQEAAARQQEAAVQLALLEQTKAQLDEGEKQLKKGEKELAKGKKEIEAQKAKLTDAKRQLTEGERQLTEGRQKLKNGENLLAEGERQLTEGERQLTEGRQKLTDGEQEIAEGEQKLAGYEEDLKEGERKYEDAKAEAAEKIADGERQLDEAEEKIRDLKKPKWYVSDRDDLPDYTGMGENADRMRNIGEVFPVLFFLVAALISLTGMTRMVEEQRTQIGTLKALGYSKCSIAGKYLGYALLATVGGSVLGVLVGEQLLPWIIIHAYGIMYHYIPVPRLPYNLRFALIASLTAILCTFAATLSACYKELAAAPAILMRPPAPKQGKRVLLERAAFLWKHLSFTWKSTVRNLFRYKKRFFMTVFGIGGCMALLLVGYGLRDSIMDVAVLQYGEIQTYDAMASLDEEISGEEEAKLTETLEKDARVDAYDSWYMKNLTSKKGKKSRDLYLAVPKRPELFEKFVNLRDRKTKEPYELSEEGVVLTEKTAKMLEASVGDVVSLEMFEGEWYEVKIAAICENYMYHYAYMTPALYEKLTGTPPKYRTVIFQTGDGEASEEIGQSILSCDGVLGVTYMEGFQERLDDMLGSLDVVIVVLIASAGLLAFVVLYNLNNININERKRELATIKVLGFYDGEVAAYVYRENVLLTFLGAGIGCGLGAALHRFVILTVEIDMCMFGRKINWSSFLYAILFTVGFSVLVNFVMYFKLKKIDMVESLKSVE